MSSTVYIKGYRNIEVNKRDLTLGDIVSVECSKQTDTAKLKALKVMKIPSGNEKRFVISVLEIISCIHKEFPSMEVQNLGEADLIITYETQKTPPKLLHMLKTAVVVMITFVGSAFSVMTFNNDVDIPKLFSQIYEWTTGQQPQGFTVLELSYSVGLSIGILVFFNHFGKKRFSVDPTPMEVEMRLYENDIQTTLVETYSRKGKEIDVD